MTRCDGMGPWIQSVLIDTHARHRIERWPELCLAASRQHDPFQIGWILERYIVHRWFLRQIEVVGYHPARLGNHVNTFPVMTHPFCAPGRVLYF